MSQMTMDMCHLSLTLFGHFLIHDLSPGFQLELTPESRLRCLVGFVLYIMVITKLPKTEQSSKGKGKTHKSTDKISQQPENWENRNGPDLVQAFPMNVNEHERLCKFTLRHTFK